MSEIIKIEEELRNENGITSLFDEILDIADDIPFGNSDFQNRMAIVDSEGSPHRALRHSLLRIINRLEALRECYFGLRKNNIEIKKLERKLENETDELERELIKIEIEKIKSSLPYTKKLIKDAIQEIKSLYPIVKKIGKISKENFEKLEYQHYKSHYENILSKPEPAIVYEKVFLQKQDLYDKILSDGEKLIHESNNLIDNK